MYNTESEPQHGEDVSVGIGLVTGQLWYQMMMATVRRWELTLGSKILK